MEKSLSLSGGASDGRATDQAKGRFRNGARLSDRHLDDPRREIHIWITPADFENAPLMILLGYILLGHPDWREAEIKLFAVFPEDEIEQEQERMLSLVRSGRLPISAKNIELIVRRPGTKLEGLIQQRSRDADLTMLGFVGEEVHQRRAEAFTGTEGLANVLFVGSTHEIELYDEEEDQEAAERESEAGTEETTRAVIPTPRPSPCRSIRPSSFAPRRAPWS